MPGPGYTTAELLSLRVTPTPPQSQSSSLTTSAHFPYQSALSDPELRAFRRVVTATPDAALAFAHYEASSASPQFVIPSPVENSVSVEWARPGAPTTTLQAGSPIAKWLRYGRTVASFNLYPACQRDLQINHLLWQTAQRGEYRPADGNLLLENNVLSLAMPSSFFSFLADISESDLKLCILELLTIIAEEEDEQGFALMKSELDESVWDDLLAYMAVDSERNMRLERLTEHGVRLSDYVALLLKLCYHSPWKIEVYCGYVTPYDMSMALLQLSNTSRRVKDCVRKSYDTFDRRLVRSHARRPIASAPHSQSSSSSSRMRAANRNAVFWKLFQDWRRYRKVLVHVLGVHPRHVVEAMLHSISRGTQTAAWERAESFIACASIEGSLVAKLPRDLVFHVIGPLVLLSESKG